MRVHGNVCVPREPECHKPRKVCGIVFVLSDAEPLTAAVLDGLTTNVATDGESTARDRQRAVPRSMDAVLVAGEVDPAVAGPRPELKMEHPGRTLFLRVGAPYVVSFGHVHTEDLFLPDFELEIHFVSLRASLLKRGRIPDPDGSGRLEIIFYNSLTGTLWRAL